MAIYSIEDKTLTALGDAVRKVANENGELYKYSPMEMVDKINDMKVIPPTAFTITGDCSYRFANGGWDWFIEQHGNNIIAENITDCSHMFYNSTVKTIPFDINVNGTGIILTYLFYGNDAITEFPKVNNVEPLNISYLFSYCSQVREIPEDYFDTWDFSTIHNDTMRGINYIFAGMSSLRKISPKLLDPLWSIGTSGSYVPYPNMFNGCCALDEINGIAIQPSALTSNRFNYAFDACQRLKNITFQVNENNNPKVAQWKNQIIDLSTIGTLTSVDSVILDSNSGITEDKKVYNDTTYQLLKDDPDWYSRDWAYSRYNHDSAVRTINTLPDTSAYGTNTIKFKGEAGSSTDGGAINTLTAEEIAVATAKGWTVSFV